MGFKVDEAWMDHGGVWNFHITVDPHADEFAFYDGGQSIWMKFCLPGVDVTDTLRQEIGDVYASLSSVVFGAGMKKRQRAVCFALGAEPAPTYVAASDTDLLFLTTEWPVTGKFNIERFPLLGSLSAEHQVMIGKNLQKYNKDMIAMGSAYAKFLIEEALK